MKAFEKVWDLETKEELFVFGAASNVQRQLMDNAEQRAQAVNQVIDTTLTFMTRDRAHIQVGNEQGRQGEGRRSWIRVIKDNLGFNQPNPNSVNAKFE